jgi:hypothetical protein
VSSEGLTAVSIKIETLGCDTEQSVGNLTDISKETTAVFFRIVEISAFIRSEGTFLPNCMNTDSSAAPSYLL